MGSKSSRIINTHKAFDLDPGCHAEIQAGCLSVGTSSGGNKYARCRGVEILLLCYMLYPSRHRSLLKRSVSTAKQTP